MTRINKSKTLTKHIPMECKCKFGGKKCKWDQKWNNNKYWCECEDSKERCMCEKYHIWDPATCTRENDKYLGSIIDDSVYTYDEIIDEVWPETLAT